MDFWSWDTQNTLCSKRSGLPSVSLKNSNFLLWYFCFLSHKPHTNHTSHLWEMDQNMQYPSSTTFWGIEEQKRNFFPSMSHGIWN